MACEPWWKNGRGEWFVVAQMVLFGLIALAPLAGAPGWPAPWGPAARFAGLSFGLAGGLLALAGIIALGRNLSALPYPKDDAELVERGPYRFVRHPIYGGLLLGAFGWGLLTNSFLTLALAAALLVLFELKTRREEAQLARRFPDYAGYRRRVRKFFPFLY
ncbi:MAG: isoprenylcysteine carboxylmethyltransferase family protein [Anaerolineales bacterium]|nr:isoprenylcysteine carboxylmethyltransferase family protein [Anaerolineales bacterium]